MNYEVLAADDLEEKTTLNGYPLPLETVMYIKKKTPRLCKH